MRQDPAGVGRSLKTSGALVALNAVILIGVHGIIFYEGGPDSGLPRLP